MIPGTLSWHLWKVWLLDEEVKMAKIYDLCSKLVHIYYTMLLCTLLKDQANNRLLKIFNLLLNMVLFVQSTITAKIARFTEKLALLLRTA